MEQPEIILPQVADADKDAYIAALEKELIRIACAQSHDANWCHQIEVTFKEKRVDVVLSWWL